MLKRYWKRFEHWKFDKKVQLLTTVTALAVSLTVTLIAAISQVSSMKQQSEELLQSQNHTIAENFRNSLDNYKSLAWAVVLDSAVQEYLKAVNKNPGTYVASESAYRSLSNYSNSFADMNFIAVVSGESGSYLYRSANGSIAATDFLKAYKKDYEESRHAQEGALTMQYNNAYYGGKRYTLNVYFPVYDTKQVNVQLGLLCINFNNSNLEQLMADGENAKAETLIVDTDGIILSCADKERMGTVLTETERISGTTGSYTQDGKTFIYQKVKNWDYYVVSAVSVTKLYEPSVRTVVMMLLILSAVLVLSTRISRYVIGRVYRPLDNVIMTMEEVSKGSLAPRINVENMGEDFAKLAIGFNSMMEEIHVLMERVKQEQHQIDQIRFNALQSQIQPHFLYNTLECIHWQAVSDGNKEISIMIKALAKYYRICLSKGREVIPLSTELEHIRNYLIIQNMRYDNIIESVFEIDTETENAMLPKLTLQPLVENSIYHGMKVKEGKKGTLFIRAKREGETVRITLSDTGTGMSQEQIDEMNRQLARYEDSFGYGVRNVNKRIELLYGKGYGLFYLCNDSGGVTVEIRIPYCTEARFENKLRGGFEDV